MQDLPDVPPHSLLGQALAYIKLKRQELLAELADIDKDVARIIETRERIGREITWLDDQYAELVEQYWAEQRRPISRRVS